jgi:hypothetical protein
LQERVFIVHGSDQVTHARGGRGNVNATHAFALPEGENRTSFVFIRHRGENPALTRIVDDKWKGRRMLQHVFYGGAVGADEVEVQVGRVPEYDASPDSAYLNELVPPSLEIPAMIRVVCRVVQQSIPVEYVEKHVIIQMADRRAWRFTGFCFFV